MHLSPLSVALLSCIASLTGAMKSGRPTRFDPCCCVLDSCRRVSTSAVAVKINEAALESYAATIVQESVNSLAAGVAWDASGWHYSDGGPLTAQYVFVMDALNFCFWPQPGVEYEHLAVSLKKALESNPSAFDAKNLCGVNEVSSLSRLVYVCLTDNLQLPVESAA
jgi:Potential Queuosine, Q, salvage protein family